jgi:CheY-like chemotaxis protein/Tfp pilus assembly protein PilZ
MAKPKNVLVVDNSKTFVTYMSYLLRKMGFKKIVIAENGKETLRILKMWTPDVIMLNISMPVMDGITALRRIKADKKTSKIPVIMVTSTLDKEKEKECRILGCTGFLTKPIKIATLHDALQESMAETGVNRRRHLRTSFKRKVATVYREKTELHYAETLSEGGIYIRKSRPLPVGTNLEVIVPLRDEKPLRLKGSVIYIKSTEDTPLPLPMGMAIQFKNISKEHSRLLSEYVTELITGKQG